MSAHIQLPSIYTKLSQGTLRPLTSNMEEGRAAKRQRTSAASEAGTMATNQSSEYTASPVARLSKAQLLIDTLSQTTVRALLANAAAQNDDVNAALRSEVEKVAAAAESTKVQDSKHHSRQVFRKRN